MSEKINIGDSLLLVLMAVLAAAWGIAGSLDVSERTHPGFKTNADHEIIWLAPGGPAEQINMQLGDRVIRVDGTPVEETSTIVRLPRVLEGERRSFTVSRDDQTIRYRPAFVKLDTREKALEHLSTVVGFAFLLIPLIACLTRPNAATRVLALMGLGLSLHFFDGPHLGSYDVHAVTVTVVRLFELLGLAAMVHFLLVFPSRRSLIDRPWGKKLVYVPVLLIWLADGWLALFTPAADSSVSVLGNGFSETGVIAYLLLGFFLLLANHLGARPSQRSELALNLMLLATIVACLPFAIAWVSTRLSMGAELPFQAHLFVLLALVPMTWSYSAARARAH